MIENLQIPNMTAIATIGGDSEQIALYAEFKLALNSYLSELPFSPVRTLADVIDFNNKHKIKVMLSSHPHIHDHLPMPVLDQIYL